MKYILSFLLCCSALAQQTVNNFAVKTNLTMSGAQTATKVNTVAELRALTPVQDGMLVQTGGYWTNGDGGGNLFRWRSGSTTTTNRGSILQLSAGGSGRFEAINLLSANIRQFGAISATNFDSSVYVQSAVDALTISDYAGGDLYLTKGQFAFANINVRGPISIWGAGQNAPVPITTLPPDYGTTIMVNAAGAAFLVSGVDPTSKRNTSYQLQPVRMNGFSIYGFYRDVDASGIKITQADYVHLSDINFYQLQQAGLNFDKSVRESVFENLRFEYCGNRDATNGPGRDGGWPVISIIDTTTNLAIAYDRHNGLRFDKIFGYANLGNFVEIDTTQMYTNGRVVGNIGFNNCWLHGWVTNATDTAFYNVVNASAKIKASRLVEIRAARAVSFANTWFWFGGSECGIELTNGLSTSYASVQPVPKDVTILSSIFDQAWQYGVGTNIIASAGNLFVGPDVIYTPNARAGNLSMASNTNITSTGAPIYRNLQSGTEPIYTVTDSSGNLYSQFLTGGVTQYRSQGGFFSFDNYAGASANKTVRFSYPNYLSSGRSVAGISFLSDVAANTIQYGGGTGLLDAATSHLWFVAPTLATTATTPTMGFTSGGLAIGSSGPASSTILDVVSTTSASRPAPTMTTVQRDAISTKRAGQVVYDSTTSRLEYYDGSMFWELAPVLKWSGALDFGNIAAGGAETQTITVPGATTSMNSQVFYPTGAGSMFFMSWVSGVDTVSVRAVNAGLAPLDLASLTYYGMLVRR